MIVMLSVKNKNAKNTKYLFTCDLENSIGPEDFPSVQSSGASVVSGGFPLHIPDGEHSVLDVMVPGQGLVVRAHPGQEDSLPAQLQLIKNVQK